MRIYNSTPRLPLVIRIIILTYLLYERYKTEFVHNSKWRKIESWQDWLLK